MPNVLLNYDLLSNSTIRFNGWFFNAEFIWVITRLTIEITKLVSEMKNGQENESHLSFQLASERKTTDSTSKSLTKCEALLKKFTDKNEQLGRENTTLADNVWMNSYSFYVNTFEWNIDKFARFKTWFPGSWTERAFKRVSKTWRGVSSRFSVFNRVTERNSTQFAAL